ncbi:hypothetical protein HDU99_007047 [Rhizoclosmatium hyalinum]|nr:hypothetical protein HDU99_007047 [Rhizoclosmatium hyalinum]
MHVLPLITLVAASIPRTTATAPTPADTALRFDINLSRPIRTTEHDGALSRLASQASDGELCLDALCKGNDHSYLYADLYVGGSKTPTKVILDTGSSDTWVTGSTCHSSVQDAKDGACEPNEAGSVTVTPTKFNSTGKTAKTIYGQRDEISVDYAIYKTSIKFGSAEVSNFPVGVVYQMSGEVTVRGVLGLGFNSLSKIEQAFKGAENANFLDALKVSRFGIYVSPLDPTKGQVNFGYFNDKKYGVPGRELQWFPVIPVNGQYGHWIIDSSQMVTKNQSIMGLS